MTGLPFLGLVKGRLHDSTLFLQNDHLIVRVAEQRNKQGVNPINFNLDLFRLFLLWDHIAIARENLEQGVCRTLTNTGMGIGYTSIVQD